MKRLLLAALLALGLSGGCVSPGAAAILSACGEDVSCVLQGSVSVVTTAGRFDTPNARLSLQVSTSGTTSPALNRVVLPSWAGVSDLWFSTKYYITPAGSNTANNIFMEFYDPGGTVRLALRGNGSGLKVSTRNAAGTYVDIGPSLSICYTTVCKLDVHIVYGTSGSINIYNNTVPAYTFTGDVTTDGATLIADASVSGPSAAGVTFNFSELIASTTDSRSLKLMACAPLAAGNTQQWTGAVGNINPTAYNDAAFNYSGTAGQLSQWTTGCSIPATVAVVDVIQSGRIARGTAGPQNFRWSLRLGATDYTNGADLSLVPSFANYINKWGPNSPASGAPWTPGDINSGFAYGLQSK